MLVSDLLGEATHPSFPPAPPLAMNYGAATITANCLDEKQACLTYRCVIGLSLSSRFRITVSDQPCVRVSAVDKEQSAE